MKCISFEDTNQKQTDGHTTKLETTSNHLHEFEYDCRNTNQGNHIVYFVTIRYLSEGDKSL